MPKERVAAARQKGDLLNYEKQRIFPFACFHTKYLMPYGMGMAIVLVSSVTALLDNTRPPSSVVLAPNVAAPGKPTMMVPRNTLLAPIEAPEAAPDDTQNTLVLAAFAVPPNATVIVFAEVNAPVERKMYTPGVLKVRFDPTDIAALTQ